MINRITLLTSILICFIPAMIGGIVTSTSVNTWYPTLEKPLLNPPNWIFGPVWTILYLLQGISLYLVRVTKQETDIKWIAYFFFHIQLFLNLLWSILFFGFKSPGAAAIEIGLLIIAVLFTIISSYRVNKLAAYLLLPYLGWISFATYLNISIYQLNR